MKDGKTETVVLTHKTEVTRDKAPAKLADVAVGDRVVIDVGTGSKPLKARSIRLGTAAPGSARLHGAGPHSARPHSAGPKKAAPMPR